MHARKTTPFTTDLSQARPIAPPRRRVENAREKIRRASQLIGDGLGLLREARTEFEAQDAQDPRVRDLLPALIRGPMMLITLDSWLAYYREAE